MGMYDYIICEAPIVGGLPEWTRHTFQTKDLDCTLELYTISKDGNFSKVDFSGTLNFYTNNIVGSGPGLYTSEGEDAESIDCEAIFLHGKLVEPIKVQRKSEPAWPAKRQRIPIDQISTRTQEEQNKRNTESLIGKRFYVLWGGQTEGYWATVVCENDRQLCVKHEKDSGFYKTGQFELIDRFYRDHIFWDSEEEVLSRDRSKREAWEAEVKAFELFQKERVNSESEEYFKV
jgi:hypothetical protein